MSEVTVSLVKAKREDVTGQRWQGERQRWNIEQGQRDYFWQQRIPT